MDLQGKTILLSGACGGIGSELAHQLAKLDTRLILLGRSESKLNALKAELANSDEHHTLAIDLTVRSDFDRLNLLCDSLARKGKAIDVLINNAGSNTFSFLSQRSESSIVDEVNVNITAPILLTKSAINWLNSPGLVVNIGSAFAAIGYPGYSTYCASKSALMRFSEAMNRELNGTGIKVLFIAPRATDTRINDGAASDLNAALGNKVDSPEWVAQHIVRHIERESLSAFLGWPEKIFATINALLPAIVSNNIAKQHATIMQFAAKK